MAVTSLLAASILNTRQLRTRLEVAALEVRLLAVCPWVARVTQVDAHVQLHRLVVEDARVALT